MQMHMLAQDPSTPASHPQPTASLHSLRQFLTLARQRLLNETALAFDTLLAPHHRFDVRLEFLLPIFLNQQRLSQHNGHSGAKQGHDGQEDESQERWQDALVSAYLLHSPYADVHPELAPFRALLEERKDQLAGDERAPAIGLRMALELILRGKKNLVSGLPSRWRAVALADRTRSSFRAILGNQEFLGQETPSVFMNKSAQFFTVMFHVIEQLKVQGGRVGLQGIVKGAQDMMESMHAQRENSAKQKEEGKQPKEETLPLLAFARERTLTMGEQRVSRDERGYLLSQY